MILATLAILASSLTGQPCAAIDNGPNTAAFKVPGQAVKVRTYTDYGDNLGYSAYVPKRAWAASRAAEASLSEGKTGHKVRLACQSAERKDLK